MRLDFAYARFFRSLNYDYLRKSHEGYVPDPWDDTPGGVPYPFVKVRLDRDITTVVGANESGKSQLLGAIKCGLTGQGIVRSDFCRYSEFFSRDSGLVVPEFGLGFSEIGEAERAVIAQMCDLDAAPAADRVALFRMNATPKLRLYVRDGEDWAMHSVKKPTMLKEFGVPTYFEIDSDVPLPDAVPIDYLATGKLTAAAGRDSHRRAFERLMEKGKAWFASAATLAASAEHVMTALEEAVEPEEATVQKYRLADDLLIKVAGLERELFEEIRTALDDGRNGYAAGIVETINNELAKSLNFPHWWSQDSFFELYVDLLDFDLVFMIRDRTGTSYSFDERSAGLKYFLSYFVQYLSHDPPDDGQAEILLMDEPDAYLSSSGQQDLLRIFASFAQPDDGERAPVQVVYVTHSPFLIDKNHAERLRVLEKGEHDEGTRVVANASRNHYEPLRSAFGSFVGETTFIGTCNLLLEGSSDQILIAGLSSWLGNRGVPDTQRLDLNTITLVPSGSASQVPYMAFLARGRDVDRPAVIALLDGDGDGDRAAEVLRSGGPRGKQLLDPGYVLQLSDADLELTSENPVGATCLEDLIPLEIAVVAMKLYCQEFVPQADLADFAPTPADVFDGGKDTLKGLEAAAREHLGDADFHLDKIGFARSVLTVLTSAPGSEATAALEQNFKRVLARLAKMQRAADREASAEKIRTRVNRTRRRFAADHPHGARREDVTLLIEEIENQLDTTVESEEVRASMRQWQRDFGLDEDPRSDIDDFPGFVRQLEGLAYAGARAVQDPAST